MCRDYLALEKFLKKFPYYMNYRDLVALEMSTVYTACNTKRPPLRIAFIGAGPLPMSPIAIAQFLARKNPPLNAATGKQSKWSTLKTLFDKKGEHKPGAHVHCIDRDPEAVEAAKKVVEKLGKIADYISFECAEAEEVTDLKQFDVVFMASLVGESQDEKNGIIRGIVKRMEEGAVLCVRSAHGLRTILYPVS